MLVMPVGGTSLTTIIGIDPGSDTVGICIMKVDVEKQLITSTQAFTIHCSNLGGSEWNAELHTDRFRRIQNLKRVLASLFKREEPTSIAVESPFFNHFRPQAYGVLVEVMTSIRHSVIEYDQWLCPYLIDPSSVKNAVGAAGYAKKDAMFLAVKALSSVINLINKIDDLDEHSIDSIAVAYTRVMRLFGKVKVPVQGKKK